MTDSTEIVPVHIDLPARRDDTVLPGTAERIASGVPKNTERAYRQGVARFEDWCRPNGRTPFPTSTATLADFVANLCDRALAPSTIEHNMYVISAQNQMLGYPPLGKETTAAARKALRGYRYEWVDDGKRVKEAPPLTMAVLRKMLAVCDPATLVGKRDRLLLTLSVAVAARRSELAAFRMSDLQVDSDGDLRVWFRKSKTDKNAVGTERIIPASGSDTNPVRYLHDWRSGLAAIGADPSAGYLLRAITKTGKLYKHGSLSGDAIDDIVRNTALRAGIPNGSEFSGHSPRAGYATEAAQARIPKSIWAEFGRWDKDSPVPDKYVRVADQKHDNPLTKMGF